MTGMNRRFFSLEAIEDPLEVGILPSPRVFIPFFSSFPTLFRARRGPGQWEVNERPGRV